MFWAMGGVKMKSKRQRKSPLKKRDLGPWKPAEDLWLPSRMDVWLEELGLGAVVKRVQDDLIGVVVDTSPRMIVAVVSPEKMAELESDDDKEPEMPQRPEDYAFIDVTDSMAEWLVLTKGSDYCLVD